MELLNPGRFAEMTPYLKSKNDVSLHLLLCSSTRGFLLATCKRLNHLQVMSTQATQYWDKNPAMHASTDSKANQGLIAIQQAYLKMQRCITTTLITVKDIERTLSILGGDIKQQYQASLAMLAQKQQQQQPGKHNQPPAEAALKKATAHYELNMLVTETPPSQFLQVIKKFFETDLKNLAATTNRSGLFFTDFPLLEIEEDQRRMAARKAQGKYVDAFKRVGLTAHDSSRASDGERGQRPPEQQQQQLADVNGATGVPWRRCVRCCSVMEDAQPTKSGMNFVLSQMRRCACGGGWGLLAPGELVL
jgi:mediator of RNA polymerase II transcription subunit 16, fungi type